MVAEVISALQPPWATTSSSSTQLYGEVAGSSPSWARANFQDRGRKHGQSMVQPELATMGMKGWYSGENLPVERPSIRRVEQASSSSYAEPVVHGAHSTYYSRRAVSSSSPAPAEFRRSIKHIPEPGQAERPQGKKYIPEPYGPLPRAQGIRPPPDEVRHRQPSTAPEPGMPRLARPVNTCGLRECDQELSYERAFGRKIRVDTVTYRGSGRAGDLSHTMGAPRRPEDTNDFFKALKDSPTFTRFCNSLPPKPAVSPHQRRAESVKRKQQMEQAQQRSLVASLHLPDEDAAAGTGQ